MWKTFWILNWNVQWRILMLMHDQSWKWIFNSSSPVLPISMKYLLRTTIWFKRFTAPFSIICRLQFPFHFLHKKVEDRRKLHLLWILSDKLRKLNFQNRLNECLHYENFLQDKYILRLHLYIIISRWFLPQFSGDVLVLHGSELLKREAQFVFLCLQVFEL